MKRRLLLGGLIAVLLSIPLGAQTLNSQIQAFWNVLRTGGYQFLTLSTAAGGYHSFGTVNGTNGYGIRDLAGTMQFKNSGGSWVNLPTTSLPVGVASGQVLVSNGVGAAPVYSATPTLTSLTLSGGTVSAPTLLFPGTNNGFYTDVNNWLIYAFGGTSYFAIIGGNHVFRNEANQVFGWSSGDARLTSMDTGFSRTGAGSVTLGNGSPADFSGTLKLTTLNAVTNVTLNGAPAVVATAPSVTSGFGSGTQGTMTSGSTTFAFRITVGTNAGGTTGVIGLPTATTFWNCELRDQNTPADITNQTASSANSVTFTTTVAWTTGDVLYGGCKGS